MIIASRYRKPMARQLHAQGPQTTNYMIWAGYDDPCKEFTIHELTPSGNSKYDDSCGKFKLRTLDKLYTPEWQRATYPYVWREEEYGGQRRPEMEIDIWAVRPNSDGEWVITYEADMIKHEFHLITGTDWDYYRVRDPNKWEDIKPEGGKVIITLDSLEKDNIEFLNYRPPGTEIPNETPKPSGLWSRLWETICCWW